MTKTYRDLLAEARATVREVSTAQAEEAAADEALANTGVESGLIAIIAIAALIFLGEEIAEILSTIGASI